MADGTEKIAIIEDDSTIREVLKMTLAAAGFKRTSAYARGDEGLKGVQREKPEILLLDLMLPGLDGMTICRRLRENAETRGMGIIMLTAKGESEDIVEGLNAGADDYVTKPFSRSVLVARMEALLRRKMPPLEQDFDGLTENPQTGVFTLNGEMLTLTKTEHKILTAFLKHRGRVYTRNLISEITGGESESRTVDVQIVGLRKKLGAWAEHIETIRGVGYRVK